MENLIVLAVGGSVITERSIDTPNVKSENINRIASEIAKAKAQKEFSLIVVHGMGAYGHPIARKYSFNSEKETQSDTTVQGLNNVLSQLRISLGKTELDLSLNNLNLEVVKTLIRHGINAVSVQSKNALTNRGKIVRISLAGVENSLSKGSVPVIKAGPCDDIKFNASILSSDHLAPYVASKLNASLLIGGTSVDGVYDTNPKNPNAKMFKTITPYNFNEAARGIVDSGYTDVTGGMLRKISEYMQFSKLGVKSRIINLTKENILSETILGKEHGTLFSDE